jgi:hypothetical protein
MAGIKAPLTDLLMKLKTLTVTNGDSSTVNPYVRVWNNQIAYFKEGKMEAWPMPAFFVEVVNSPTYEILGQQYRSTDLSFRVHIVHEFYDAVDGTMEQDLIVFDLRDKIVANLTALKLTGCGPLESMSETQDYEHDNVYHYVVDFVCNFTDTIGSKYDANHPQAYIFKTPPTDQEADITIAAATVQTSFNQSFAIPNGL